MAESQSPQKGLEDQIFNMLKSIESNQILFFSPGNKFPNPEKGKKSPLSYIPPANLPVVS